MLTKVKKKIHYQSQKNLLIELKVSTIKKNKLLNKICLHNIQFSMKIINKIKHYRNILFYLNYSGFIL